MPIAVQKKPDVFPCKHWLPIATLLLPKVLAVKQLCPIAVFSIPVLFCKLLEPNEIFPVAPGGYIGKVSLIM